MILQTIWERYLMKEIIKIFSLFLFGLFFLYAAIDYSMHMQDFAKDKRIEILDLSSYYLFHFVKRANLLMPLALLIATIKVLSSFNLSRELTALQACGMKTTTLLRPFFLLACACASFNYLNLEFFVPKSLNYLDHFHELHFTHSERGKRKEKFHILHLKDNSKLIYQTYHQKEHQFFDCIWICSSDDIWRIKFLSANPNHPVGKFVDHLKRNEKGEMEKKESFDSHLFKNLSWETTTSSKGFIPIENRSISELYFLLKENNSSSYENSEILTQLIFKCTLPLLSFLIIIASAPFCMNYSRNLPVFLIYGIALFLYISFFMLMDASLILGSNKVLHPIAAIFIPFFSLAGFFGWKFFKSIYFPMKINSIILSNRSMIKKR